MRSLRERNRNVASISAIATSHKAELEISIRNKRYPLTWFSEIADHRYHRGTNNRWCHQKRWSNDITKIRRPAAAAMLDVSEDYLRGLEDALKAVRNTLAKETRASGFPSRQFSQQCDAERREEKASFLKLEALIAKLTSTPSTSRAVGSSKRITCAVPDAIAHIENLDRHEEQPCVYFLCKEKQVVYVGQTTCLTSRLKSHRRDKDFDEAFFLPVPAEMLLEVEQQLISEHRPKYNTNGVYDRPSPAESEAR